MLGRLRNALDYTLAALAYAATKMTSTGASASLTPLTDVERFSSRVVRVLGQNPGSFTLQGTNTYLVGSQQHKVLIDTGERNVPRYIELLRESLGGATLDCILITHWHPDHVGGITQVQQLVGAKVPVYKLRRAGETIDEGDVIYVDDGFEVRVDDQTTLRLIHTPGHTVDHAAVWLAEERALFSGDCVLGEGSSVFEDLHSYMQSLKTLLSLDPVVIYPGHGKVVETPKEKIGEYITHRLKRESQIVESLQRLKQATPMDLTNAIYTDVSWSLKIAAMENVKHHLTKLAKDGRVREAGGGKYECAT